MNMHEVSLRFLVTLLLMIQVSYNVAPCRPVNGYRRFGGALYFLLQGQTLQDQTLLSLHGIKYSTPAKSSLPLLT